MLEATFGGFMVNAMFHFCANDRRYTDRLDRIAVQRPGRVAVDTGTLQGRAKHQASEFTTRCRMLQVTNHFHQVMTGAVRNEN